jgi:Spy/CpxP family protein refolding chaperone
LAYLLPLLKVKLIKRKEVRRMKKTVVAIGLLALVILGVTYAYAQGPGFGPGFGPGHRGGPYCDSLNRGKQPALTPEQQTKFQELHQKWNEEAAQLREDIVTKRLELQSLWANPNSDSKAIVDKEKELRDLQNQMKDKMIQFRLEARTILTPDQISQFGQGRMKGPGFGFGRMRGHGYGMGPGYGPCR